MLKKAKYSKPFWLFVLCLGGLAAIYLARFVPFFSPLIIAVLMGATVANLRPSLVASLYQSGADKLAAKQILRFGVVLYGFSLSIDDILLVGFWGVGLAAFMVFAIFFIGFWLGGRIGLDRITSALVACGSAICGAAAVLALASVIKADSKKIAVALATVVVYGTLGMFLYVLVFSFVDLGLNPSQMGYLLGASLHEVAHVVAAGAAIGETTGHAAVIIKMLRVLMLVPFLFMAAFMFKSDEARGGILGAVPYFALGFLVMVLFGSMPFFPHELLPYIKVFDTFLLCVAMFALGFSLSARVFIQAGTKPFLLAGLLAVLLFVFAYSFSLNL